MPIVLICALALLAGPALAEPSDIRHARVGEVVMLKLPGNPKAGYRWQLSSANSRGLDLVKVDQLGWILSEEGRSMFFKQESLLNVAVHANAPGTADITFEYWRATAAPLLIRSTTTRVVIAAKSAAN
ncbi:MAG: protease inhibitor I42 family protein [Hyphomicrobiales bacterium]